MAGEVRGPGSITKDQLIDAARQRIKDDRLRAGRLPLEDTPRSSASFTPSRPISRRASMPRATRTKAPATRASCSAMPARETPELMPAPLQYSHADPAIDGRCASLRRDARFRARREEPGDAAIRQRQAGAARPRSSSRPSIRDESRARKRCARSCARTSSRSCRRAGCATRTHFYVNPTGRFVIGGPDGDAGLTGRKIIVDTYGGAAPHGGGAFSGKDPTKVDRSAAYAARYLAKNVVAAGLAERCTIQLAYAIGVVEAALGLCRHRRHRQGRRGEARQAFCRRWSICRPRGIRTHLGLNKPIYARTAAYGHFGRTPDADGGFSWEKTDLAAALKGAF